MPSHEPTLGPTTQKQTGPICEGVPKPPPKPTSSGPPSHPATHPHSHPRNPPPWGALVSPRNHPQYPGDHDQGASGSPKGTNGGPQDTRGGDPRLQGRIGRRARAVRMFGRIQYAWQLTATNRSEPIQEEFRDILHECQDPTNRGVLLPEFTPEFATYPDNTGGTPARLGSRVLLHQRYQWQRQGQGRVEG